MRHTIRLLKNMVTGTHPIGARPTLSTDGVDITAWASGSGQFPDCSVFIDGDQAMNINVPAGGLEGVELWGYQFSQWWLIGSLHDGAVIRIAADGQGFSQELQDLGDFDRLYVSGTPSIGTATAKFCPKERHTI
jgi:hypothetical protein